MLNDILEHYPEPPFPLDYSAVTDGLETINRAIREMGLAMPPATEIIRMDEDGLPSIHPPNLRPTRKIISLLGKLPKYMREDGGEWKSAHAQEVNAQLDGLNRVRLDRLEGPALANHLQEALDLANAINGLRFSLVLPMIINGKILLFLAKKSGVKNALEGDLVGGLEYKTVEINKALKRLARTVMSDGEVRDALAGWPAKEVWNTIKRTDKGREFRNEFLHFLERYGDRAPKAKLPFSAVSWSDEPGMVLSLLAAMVQPSESEYASLSQVDNHSDSPFLRFRDQVANRLPGPLCRLFLRSLENYRSAHIMREDTLYVTERTYAAARHAALEAGRRFAAEGLMTEQGQVLFLTLREMYAALQGRLDPEEVRKRVDRRKKARPRAEVIWRGENLISESFADDILSGQAGSPGQARGTVKVISGPEGFSNLKPGDVLVCRFTDPTWTPLFEIVSAVVSDTGGSLSHAAIVAREYGIPAVLGTRIATKQLRVGDKVLVDGDRGMVRVEKAWYPESGKD
ncbi:PEP-utilizing enzyme [Paenibacillus aurantius]|uniref:PEP-utilizing enzyme n=1 Tax=Paenibacillus aurantius TaxID=2918900 RepID=A0AA96RGM8_9BACL|nr:PEP-utilizing enzyme [Paenibacillus aurantius]WNQ13197.1 PEP-utilizing enzyme [Paenibacillus aurantius]